MGGARRAGRPGAEPALNGAWPCPAPRASHSYRSTVAVYGERYLLPLAAENRAKAGVEAGDEVEVALELDTAPRVVEVPGDFAQALASEPAARQTWDGLSYSNQRYHVLQIEGAKTEETRQRRIAKSIGTLSQGKPR